MDLNRGPLAWWLKVLALSCSRWYSLLRERGTYVPNSFEGQDLLVVPLSDGNTTPRICPLYFRWKMLYNISYVGNDHIKVWGYAHFILTKKHFTVYYLKRRITLEIWSSAHFFSRSKILYNMSSIANDQVKMWGSAHYILVEKKNILQYII